MVGILDYDARRQGRERLQHSEMEDLPSLFRCEPNEGRDGEPASIRYDAFGFKDFTMMVSECLEDAQS